MSLLSIDPVFQPRKGNLVAVVVARISTLKQDERSNDDQDVFDRRWLTDRYDGPVEWKLIASRGSGEFLDREELLELERLIESDEIDVVICEDLARICRRIRAYELCELAVDHGVRVIAINDHVDTAKSDWQMSAFFAAFRHESYNRDTAARIRRTQRNRFQSGGMVKCVLFCYVKPPGCKSDADVRKNADLEWVVLGIIERLENGWSYSRVADWLNENHVPVGAGCRRKTWDRSLVRYFIFNSVLKGVRVWNEKKSLRINKTGRRKSVKAAAEERLERHVPHWAFVEADRYDRLIEKLVKQNAKYSVPNQRGDDPRKGRPKKRTRWPGQHVFCELCGNMFVYGGHGQAQHLMCNGAKQYHCWNGVTCDGELAARKISEAVHAVLSGLPDFEPALLAALQDEAVQRQQDQVQQRDQADRDLDKVRREEERLVEAIKSGGGLEPLVNALKDVQSRKRELEHGRRQLQKQLPPPVEMPSVEQIRNTVREAFSHLSATSTGFGDVMRLIIPRIVAFPVRLCDGGHPVLRAQFQLDLSPYLPEALRLPSVENQLRKDLVVDLFEMPQRAAFREQVIALRAQGLTERQVASQLGLTVAATQRAAALDRLMRDLGLTDPYVRLTEPPADYTRLSRHLHPRYRQRKDDDAQAA
jgi:hypothetical protein